MSATVRNESLLNVEVGELLSRPLAQKLEPAATTVSSDELRMLHSSGYSGIVERSAPLHSFLERGTLFMFPVLFCLNLYFGVARLYELELIWLVALGIPLGLVFGDFVTGVVHWVGDTYFSEDTPIIGPGFVKPFRLHHQYPRDICTHNLVTTLGNSCIIAVPALLLCLYLFLTGPVSAGLAFAVLFVTILAIATVATNQFHKWAHEEAPSNFARWLQRKRLVLEPSHHDIHHQAPFDMHYCITNGWLNPFLNRIKFFRRVEVLLNFIGIEPTRSKEHES
jgi:hypothetical protein